MSKSGIPIVSDVAKGVGKVVQPIAKAIRPIAPILPFIPIPGMFGLSSLLTRSLLTGALGGFDKQGKFDIGRGMKTGLLAYGVGSLMNPATAASGTPGISGFGAAADEVGGALSGDVSPFGVGGPQVVNAGVAMPATAPVTISPIAPTTASAAGPSNVFEFGYPTTAGTGAAPITSVEGTGLPGLSPGAAGPGPTTAQSFGNLATAAGERALDVGVDAAKQIIKNPVQSASLALTGYGAIKSKEELDRQKAEADRILKNRERERAEDVAQAEGFLRDYPLLYKRLTEEDVQRMGLASGGMADPDSDDKNEYEMGGLAALAAGGMPPRYLRGGGDGMSDSIPARIGEKQEARLADGEFVVPADVVSHIGNGSSNAGAKKLYAMMDRVRQARTGKTRQAPAVNMRRMMPV